MGLGVGGRNKLVDRLGVVAPGLVKLAVGERLTALGG